MAKTLLNMLEKKAAYGFGRTQIRHVKTLQRQIGGILINDRRCIGGFGSPANYLLLFHSNDAFGYREERS